MGSKMGNSVLIISSQGRVRRQALSRVLWLLSESDKDDRIRKQPPLLQLLPVPATSARIRKIPAMSAASGHPSQNNTTTLQLGPHTRPRRIHAVQRVVGSQHLSQPAWLSSVSQKVLFSSCWWNFHQAQAPLQGRLGNATFSILTLQEQTKLQWRVREGNHCVSCCHVSLFPPKSLWVLMSHNLCRKGSQSLSSAFSAEERCPLSRRTGRYRNSL